MIRKWSAKLQKEVNRIENRAITLVLVISSDADHWATAWGQEARSGHTSGSQGVLASSPGEVGVRVRRHRSPISKFMHVCGFSLLSFPSDCVYKFVFAFAFHLVVWGKDKYR